MPANLHPVNSRAYFWVDWLCVLAPFPVLTFLWAIRSFFSVNYTKWLAVLIENSGASVFSGNGVNAFMRLAGEIRVAACQVCVCAVE